MNCMYENIVDFYNNYFKSLGWFLISWEYIKNLYTNNALKLNSFQSNILEQKTKSIDQLI